MINLINDLSILTNVPDTILEKFVPISTCCIGHAVHENFCRGIDTTEVDLGFGELHIKVFSEGIRYKFIPSKELEQTLIKTVTNKTSPIVDKIDKELKEKLNRTYKELL